ncbi:AfsR/SARP family transcriptional regulator [Nocardia sp. IBHARD005]|uniref:AfsR/SARP family transcriptional regulator n=1 Tax=Nocardia sp. IBHARD005 TaxID=3457765 RepID=UPI004059E052
MRYRVLGPIEMSGADGTVVDLTGDKVRTLLAVLLARGDGWVSAEDLIDALWPASPPQSARGGLKTYIWQLRQLHAEAGDDHPARIVSRAGAYRIQVERAELDAWDFEAAVAAGRQALADDRPDLAHHELARAGSLWGGEPFPEAPLGTVAGYRARLTELRADSKQLHADAFGSLGRFAEGIGGLRALLAEDPLRESTWTRLVYLLVADNRRPEAMHAYHQARRLLDDELGTGPGPELRRIYRELLLTPDEETLDNQPAHRTAEHPAADAALRASAAARAPELVDLAGDPEPESVIASPSRPARGPFDAERPAFWLVGAHGGAGVSMLTAALAPTAEAGREWPVRGVTESPITVIVAREHRNGLLAAERLLIDFAEGRAPEGLIVAGLLTVASTPGPLPRSLAQHRDRVAALVDRDWRIGWIESWRTAAPEQLCPWSPDPAHGLTTTGLLSPDPAVAEFGADVIDIARFFAGLLPADAVPPRRGAGPHLPGLSGQVPAIDIEEPDDRQVEVLEDADGRPVRATITRRVRRAALVGALPLALVVGATGSGAAAPGGQAGVTAPPSQVGVTTPVPNLPAPGPIVPEESGGTGSPYLTPPPTYPVPPRAKPQRSEVAPLIVPEQLHAPQPVEPVAPIQPDPGTLRVGDYEAGRPEWMPVPMQNTINAEAAVREAQWSTMLTSIGVPATRADRVAAGTLAGTALGATAAGVPAALAGGAAGAAVGGVVGGVVGGGIGLLGMGVGAIPGAIIGAGVGAGVGAAAGAALTGASAAAAGGTIGGSAGGELGARDAAVDGATPVADPPPVVAAAAASPALPTSEVLMATAQSVLAGLPIAPIPPGVFGN